MAIVVNCEYCGDEFTPKKWDHERGGGRFCSLRCMGLSRRGGDWKPNWRGGKEVRPCLICGIEFEVWPSEKKRYCSPGCAGVARRGKKTHNRKKRWVELICAWCGQGFRVEYTHRERRKYCSRECSAKGVGRTCSGENNHQWKDREEWICKRCGVISGGTPYEAQNRQFCSPDCSRMWLVESGVFSTPPSGPVELVCEHCGIVFEVAKPSRARKFCSSDCRYTWYSETYNGEDSPNWRGGSASWLGGKSFEPYGVEFDDRLREMIRSRDNYVCQLCGDNGGDCALSVHHIDYDKKNNAPENLISLCRPCHGETGFNREQWAEILSEMVA